MFTFSREARVLVNEVILKSDRNITFFRTLYSKDLKICFGTNFHMKDDGVVLLSCLKHSFDFQVLTLNLTTSSLFLLIWVFLKIIDSVFQKKNTKLVYYKSNLTPSAVISLLPIFRGLLKFYRGLILA